MVRIIFLIFISSFIIVTGCSSASEYKSTFTTRQEHASESIEESRVQDSKTSIASTRNEENENDPSESTGNLTKVVNFSGVLSRVISSNPTLASYSHQIASANALIRQARLIPNPELEVEIEEFGGDNDGFNQTETTISLVQPLELGGKRGARSELASSEKDLRTLEAKVLVSETVAEAQLAYNEVVFAQAMVEILEGQVGISKAVVSAIRKKLSAGSVLPVEKTKAEITLRNDELDLESAQQNLVIARFALSSLWNGEESEIGDLQNQLSLTDSKSYLVPLSIEDSPQYQLALSKVNVAKKRLKVEKSLGVPDASFGLGYRRLKETSTNTYLGLFSIALPVVNRNQGAIESARQEQSISKFEGMNTKLSLRRRIISLQATLRKLINEHRSIEGVLLPSVNKAFVQAKSAYQMGRTSYLELLDAQRTLVETKKRKQEVLLLANQAQASIADIMGKNVKTIVGEE